MNLLLWNERKWSEKHKLTHSQIRVNFRWLNISGRKQLNQKIKKTFNPHTKSILKLRLRETWYVPTFKVQDQLNQDARIVFETAILKTYTCNPWDYYDETQKVLKDNSPLIDGQLAKTLWKYMKIAMKKRSCKHEINLKYLLLKTGTVGQIMLGRWMISITYKLSQDLLYWMLNEDSDSENQAWMLQMKMAGT